MVQKMHDLGKVEACLRMMMDLYYGSCKVVVAYCDEGEKDRDVVVEYEEGESVVSGLQRELHHSHLHVCSCNRTHDHTCLFCSQDQIWD